jgi:O-antigen/teichoic acid export membrane protein
MAGPSSPSSLTPEPDAQPAGLDTTPGRNVARFTGINLVGSAVPLIVSIVTIPIYLSMLGEVRYGIWLVAWVLIGYFGAFDLGLGRAIANGVAKLRGGPASEREAVVWTGVAVNLGFGVLVGAVALGGAELALRLSDEFGRTLRHELLAALPWLAATVPLLVVGSVLAGALEGLDQFLVVNTVGTLGGIGVQCLPLAAAALIAPRLDVLAAATTLALALSTVLAALACVVYLPLTTRPRFDRAQARALLGFGAWISVTSLISPLMSTLDKLIIGAVSGARAVTYYTVPFNLVTRLWIIPTALVRSLFPSFSHLSGLAARTLANDSSRVLSAIMTPIIVVAIIAVDPFMRAWVGEAFANEAARPAEILLLGLWANSLAFIPYTFLQAQGRPDLPAKFHLLELLPFLGLLWLGIKVGGVAGAAAAWSVRVLVDTTLLLIAAKNRPRSQAYLVPAATLAVSAFVLAQVMPSSLSARLLACLFFLALALVWAWLVAPPSLRRYALRFRPKLRTSTR